MSAYSKLALFVGGTLFGTAGIKLLSSKDAKKIYTHVTAAVLRCKDEVVKNAEVLQENCADILADAKDINEERAEKAEAEVIENARAILAEAEAKAANQEAETAEA